ncbi:hypothetical protein OC861_001630 [Tilletia horrida]|nr:hypothetical protein OC861_001630 [Tilletia horrida]
MAQQRNSPQDCLRNPELQQALPDECKGLYRSYVECRRSMLDMRKRFRGNFLTPPGVCSSPATSSDPASASARNGPIGGSSGGSGSGAATSSGLGASPSAGISPS